MKQDASAGRYMPQLDSLRAIAVIAVLAQHFGAPAIVTCFPPGDIGVFLFFVLSGFLITGIILNAKRESTPIHWKLKVFYWRRSLRIFPIYYLTLLFATLLFARMGDERLKSELAWHATYTSNYYFASQNAWTDGAANHLWTLSLEEQFYLIWPLIILLVPWRIVPVVIWTTVISGSLFRLSLYFFAGGDALVEKLLLPCCVDSLGLGALLAHLVQQDSLILKKMLGRRRWLNVVAVLFLIIWWCLYHWRSETGPISTATYVLLLSAVGAWVIFLASRGITGWAGTILNSPVLKYLGRISYGIYLYHLFVAQFISLILWKKHIQMTNHLVSFILFGSATVGVAVASSALIEKPLARYKDLLTRREEELVVPALERSC